MLVVSGAGNGNAFRRPNNNDAPALAAYPASYELNNVIAVAATDQNDQLVPFSNFGAESVDIAAWGTAAP